MSDSKVYCGNTLCVYQDGGRCMLDAVTLDDRGICEDMIALTFSDSAIMKQKKMFFEERGG